MAMDDSILVIGQIRELTFNFYVTDDFGQEVLLLDDNGLAGIMSGTVDNGLAYLRTGSSPRAIGQVKYSPGFLVKRKQVSRASQNAEQPESHKRR